MSTKKEKCCGLDKGEDGNLYHWPDCRLVTIPITSESIEWESEFVESGASIEHDRWARWQKYMFSKGTVDENGVFHLPKEFVDRWFRQIDTHYSELSEAEKESDRKESRTYIPLVQQAITTAVAKREKELVEEVEKWKEGNCKQCGEKANGGRGIPNWNCKQHAYLDVLSLFKH